jgi:tetratricopeptide (TPR) repeat protein
LNKRPAILAIGSLLTLATLICYWPVTTHQFIGLDDHEYIYDNPHVNPGFTWAGVRWAFQTGYASNWHPLTWLSHMGDCQLYGLNPAGHHLTNLLFHIANTLLLFLLLLRLTGPVWRSACVAALFAWHPLHVESVAWASERKDVLSTFFFLLTLLAYARYVEVLRLKSKVQSQKTGSGGQKAETGIQPPESRIQNKASGATPHATRNTARSPVPSSTFAVQSSMFDVRPSSPRFWYWVAVVMFALGLMSKPMLVTLPFVLLLLDFWPLQRLSFLPSLHHSITPTLHHSNAPTFQPSTTPILHLFREKLPFFALALAASVVTYRIQQTGGAVSSLEILPLQSRVANALVVYVRYLLQTLWPAQLAVLYPYSRHLPVGAVVAAGLLLAALSSWFVLRARRQPFLIVGWLWYLGTLVPAIGLVQVGSQAMADRYTYIPSIGLFLLIVWGLNTLSDSWPHKRCWLAAAGTLALAGCLACTWGQLKCWQDSEKLFRHAIAVTTDNYIAYDGLGNALDASGKSDQALACYAEAVRLKPNYPEGQYDLGTTLLKRGRLAEAVEHLTAAVKHNPAFAHAHINLGKALLEQGKLEEAADHLAKAVRLTPDDAEAQYNLGTLLQMQGKPDEAVVCFSEALRLKPDYGEAHGNLGVALMRQGKLSEGATHLAAALDSNPNNPEAHYNLGLALLELNHPREAADQFTEALRLNPDAPGTHYHLALALVREGKPQEALPHAQRARDLALAAGQSALTAKAEALLKQLR